MLLGIDIYNGNSDAYNFGKARADGISFVIHKMSQGWGGGPGGWMDWKVQNGLARARSAGMPLVGGYHWLLRGNGAAQADLYYNSMRACGGPRGMLAAVDVERNDWNQSLNPDHSTLCAFLDRWEWRSGGQPILVYSAPWYWGPYLGNPTDIGARKVTRPWTAAYFEPYGQQHIGDAVKNVTPGYWQPWGGFPADDLKIGRGIRQWTSRGVVAGVPSDCNYFDGNYAQLAAMTVPEGSVPLPPPPPPVVVCDVRQIQAAVHAAVDGIWGPDTDRRCELVRHRGPDVSALQRALLVKPDGIWGPITEAAEHRAVEGVQAALHVVVDGVWGPITDKAYCAASPLRLWQGSLLEQL